MNGTSLCLNVDIKVNLDNPDSGPPRPILWARAGILIQDDLYSLLFNVKLNMYGLLMRRRVK